MQVQARNRRILPAFADLHAPSPATLRKRPELP